MGKKKKGGGKAIKNPHFKKKRAPDGCTMGTTKIPRKLAVNSKKVQKNAPIGKKNSFFYSQKKKKARKSWSLNSPIIQLKK